MNEKRYQEDLIISPEDFISSEWNKAINELPQKSYPMIWQTLSEAARSAIDQNENERGKVLWLLADACSMMLSPSSQNEPFKPFSVFHDRRSVIPDDLLETDINFFAQIVDLVEEKWVKARISELIWLKGKPRNTSFALKAIDAYRSIPLEENTWIHGGRDCWPRAIKLAHMLKNNAGDRLEKIE